MNQSQTNTKMVRLVKLAMMSAISLVLLVLIRIPFPPAPFLVYDPADIPIFICTFAFGPLSGLAVTFVVSFIQAFTMAGDGIIGFLMHMLATGSFVLVAGIMYKRNKTRKRAAFALLAGIITWTTTMLLWNLLITPFYMGVPREAVVAMLLPIILPFNLLKAGTNAIVTFLIYKRIANYLHK